MFKITDEHLKTMQEARSDIADIDLHVVDKNISDLIYYLDNFKKHLEKLDNRIKEGDIRLLNKEEFRDLKVSVFDSTNQIILIRSYFSDMEDKLQEVTYSLDEIKSTYDNEQRYKQNLKIMR